MSKRISRIIIHDLKPDELDIQFNENDIIVSKGSPIGQCIGWIASFGWKRQAKANGVPKKGIYIKPV